MSLNILNKVVSPTGKRMDCQVKVSGLFVEPYEIDLRILSREVMNENQIEDLIDQVIDRKKNWKQGKKNLSLNLNGINANAYITKIKSDADNS